MVTEAKQEEVAALKSSFNEANVAIFTSFSGMTVENSTALRKNLRASGAKLKVVKNTLAKIAAKGTPFEAAQDVFSGPVSVAFGFGDDVGAPAKVISDFARKDEKLKILGGFIDGSILDDAGVKKLASTPPKPVVQAMFLGLMQAPVRNFLGVMEGTARKFLYALHAIAEKKKEGGEA